MANKIISSTFVQKNEKVLAQMYDYHAVIPNKMIVVNGTHGYERTNVSHLTSNQFENNIPITGNCKQSSSTISSRVASRIQKTGR